MPEYTIEGGAPKRSTRWTIYRDGEALATVYDHRDATMLVVSLLGMRDTLTTFGELHRAINADPEPALPPPLAGATGWGSTLNLGPSLTLRADNYDEAIQSAKIINVLTDAVRALRTCDSEIMRITVAEQMDAELRVLGIPEEYLR